eukprot:739358-Pelagomonas_calceolata.AAC.1
MSSVVELPAAPVLKIGEDSAVHCSGAGAFRGECTEVGSVGIAALGWHWNGIGIQEEGGRGCISAQASNFVPMHAA